MTLMRGTNAKKRHCHRFSWTRLLTGLIVLPALLFAEHFDIQLSATGSDGVTVEAYADQAPPAGGLNPRPVLKARAGSVITMQFVMTNVYPHGFARSAGIRYYVVRRDRNRQDNVPALRKDEQIIEGSFTLDVKPKARIGARQQFVVREPGFYLPRGNTPHPARPRTFFRNRYSDRMR